MVLALGIWFEDGGKVGVFFALLFRGLFGYGAYAVPLLVALAALALFWRPAAKDEMVAGRVTIESQTGKVLAGPDIVTRGFVYEPESGDLIEEAKARVLDALERT
ncbi:MAG TPA: hypothetical protein VG673_09310, partial [Actinomycetota bacterium]|nr:hypothetical protein [Actinomycetota bacterium]